MRRTFSGRRAEHRRQAALSVGVRALVERHLRDLARAGRLREAAWSRDALAEYYRARGNDAASYYLAGSPDFSLTATLGGGVRLTLLDSGDLVSWTRSELLQEGTPGAANEIESRAIQMAGGPDRFRTLSQEEQEALTAQAVQEVIREQRNT